MRHSRSRSTRQRPSGVVAPSTAHARPDPLLGGRLTRRVRASRNRVRLTTVAHQDASRDRGGANEGGSEEERPMALPAPDLRKKTDAELWEILHLGDVDSPIHKQCLVMLEMRNIEKQLRAATEQARAAADQATASHGMVAATRSLTAFTQGLVRAAWALFAVAVATLVFTVVQVLIATKVIGS